MEKKEFKLLIVATAIICISITFSECVSVTTTKTADTFTGPPLASATVYGMSASEYFVESDGYAIVTGRRQHYYLYQFTDTSDNQLLTILIVRWIQGHGYILGKGELVENNIDLADSVKTLMKSKGANYSVTIWGDGGNLLLYINVYNTNIDTYDTVIWPLLKT